MKQFYFSFFFFYTNLAFVFDAFDVCYSYTIYKTYASVPDA